MSQKLKTLKEKLRRAIRKELVEYDNLNTRKEDELEEASMTGNLDGGEGPPKTPYAFQSKKKRAQDKKKEDEISTNSTGFVKMNENKLNEAKGWKLLNNVLLKYTQHHTKKLALALKRKDEKLVRGSVGMIIGGLQAAMRSTLDKRGFQLDESINEGKYHQWRNDESLTPKQKIGRSMREVRDSLNGLSKTIDMSVKLKNELNVNSSDYWKTTHKALGKISERLVKLANKVGKLQ
jgi:hypothetical protein